MSSEDFVKTWNICDKNYGYKDFQNRNNDILEIYNRTINDIFPTLYPSASIRNNIRWGS